MFAEVKDRIFENRQDAGEALGMMLEPKYKASNALVIGIPRGGVEVAYYVAKRLGAELSLVVAKKLPFPGHAEFGFGAVAEDYSVYISPYGEKSLSPEVINQIIDEQIDEIKRRVKKYRNGKPLPLMAGRTVIVVDDGIATGVTLAPVIKLCRRHEAAKVVIAAPVSGKSFNPELREADDIVVVVQPEPFYAVSQVYRTFGDFSDDQLIELLRKFEQELKPQSGN